MEEVNLKTVLDEKNEELKEDIVIRKKHKKPMQLRDIENRSVTSRQSSKTESHEDIHNLLNKEKNDIFKQPWNRLDTGMKLNRIRLFTESEGKEKGLTKEKQEELRTKLANACRSNKLNKNTDVEYCIDECKIKKIKPLMYNGSSIQLIINETKKTKKTTKSKSNIDRFINKKS